MQFVAMLAGMVADNVTVAGITWFGVEAARWGLVLWGASHVAEAGRTLVKTGGKYKKTVLMAYIALALFLLAMIMTSDDTTAERTWFIIGSVCALIGVGALAHKIFGIFNTSTNELLYNNDGGYASKDVFNEKFASLIDAASLINPTQRVNGGRLLVVSDYIAMLQGRSAKFDTVEEKFIKAIEKGNLAASEEAYEQVTKLPWVDTFIKKFQGIKTVEQKMSFTGDIPVKVRVRLRFFLPLASQRIKHIRQIRRRQARPLPLPAAPT